MVNEPKNRIDGAIDEVIESKRLRQGVSALIKITIIGAIGFGAFLVLGVAMGWIR